MINLEDMVRFFSELSKVYRENEQMLTDLDSAIGDGDHGTNLRRGFNQVIEDIEANPPVLIDQLLKRASMQLIKTVGGASGPLYGTFFLKASIGAKDKKELGSTDIAEMFRKGLDGVMAIGKAVCGEKTMIDTLFPVVEYMEKHTDQSIKDMLQAAVIVANTGKESTINIQATKGRASYLGERSIGHQDPGATSSYLLILTASKVFE